MEAEALKCLECGGWVFPNPVGRGYNPDAGLCHSCRRDLDLLRQSKKTSAQVNVRRLANLRERRQKNWEMVRWWYEAGK